MFKAKKSLGQNFLADQSALRTIIETSKLTSADTVLEIGPGTGFLTEALLQTGARVIAVEKDDRLISVLAEKFSAEIKNKKLELIHADILKFKSAKLEIENWKLVANIPYYLTGQIIRHFLSAKNQPQNMTLMFLLNVICRPILWE